MGVGNCARDMQIGKGETAIKLRQQLLVHLCYTRDVYYNLLMMYIYRENTERNIRPAANSPTYGYCVYYILLSLKIVPLFGFAVLALSRCMNDTIISAKLAVEYEILH